MLAPPCSSLALRRKQSSHQQNNQTAFPNIACSFIHATRAHPHLEQARAAALNGLHLGLGESRPPEPLRELVAVPNLALLRLDTAQHPRGATSNSAVDLSRCLRC
jgi:hypothetical protein